MLSEAMTAFLMKHLKAHFPWAAAMVEPHLGMVRKAISFALIGLVNASIDTAVFLLGYMYLTATPAAMDALADWTVACGCMRLETAALVAPNVLSWLVAVSCSYVMNSFITFAAESGRKLRWKSYGTFVASGVLGAAANTLVLVMAADLMPVVAAKICAIVAGFGVNFSMSHFVVFRRRPDAAQPTHGA
jgi:putative flippase GtrA